ncbi:MAG: hypothetical protein ACKOWW_05360 [Flavobacteriales bacterium]
MNVYFVKSRIYEKIGLFLQDMLLKTRLHEHLFQLLEARISTLSAQRTQMSHDSTASGKGSAGDKHEVGIAMAQLEIEKIDQQIALSQQQLSALKRIDPTQVHRQVQSGSLFQANDQVFYCAVPLGQIELDGSKVFCLSPEAPIFQALKGSSIGVTLLFNSKKWTIEKLT